METLGRGSPTVLPRVVADQVATNPNLDNDEGSSSMAMIDVKLPDERIIALPVETSKAMLDLLINICSTVRLSPADHTLQVLDRDKPAGNKRAVVDYKANQSLQSLGVAHVMLNLVNKESNKNKNSSNSNSCQPFEMTRRVTINLPFGQKYVVRVGSDILLSELFKMAVEYKNLDPNTHRLFHPQSLKQELDMSAPLDQYGINEICLCNINVAAPSTTRSNSSGFAQYPKASKSATQTSTIQSANDKNNSKASNANVDVKSVDLVDEADDVSQSYMPSTYPSKKNGFLNMFRRKTSQQWNVKTDFEQTTPNGTTQKRLLTNATVQDDSSFSRSQSNANTVSARPSTASVNSLTNLNQEASKSSSILETASGKYIGAGERELMPPGCARKDSLLSSGSSESSSLCEAVENQANFMLSNKKRAAPRPPSAVQQSAFSGAGYVLISSANSTADGVQEPKEDRTKSPTLVLGNDQCSKISPESITSKRRAPAPPGGASPNTGLRVTNNSTSQQVEINTAQSLSDRVSVNSYDGSSAFSSLDNDRLSRNSGDLLTDILASEPDRNFRKVPV